MFFEWRELPLIVGTAVHGLLAAVLLLLAMFLRSPYRTGSRVAFTLLMFAVNMAFLYLWATRWIAVETVTRPDGVTYFLPFEYVSTFVAVAAAFALCMFVRLEALSVAAAVLIYALGAGAALVTAAETSRFLVSFYWWLVAAIVAALVVVQVAAWILVPDRLHVPGTKAARRGGVFSWLLGGVYIEFVVAAVVWTLLGPAVTGAFHTGESAMYNWLVLGTYSLPVAIIMPAVGLPTYWSDVHMPGAAPPAPA